MKKINLKKELQDELNKIYHNATLHGKLIAESDFESDLVDSELRFRIEMSFEDLKLELPEIFNYGKVYQYGRGGRTVCPEKLVSGGVYWRIKKVTDLEMTASELRTLLKVLKKFNALVRDFCSSVTDSVIEDIRLEYAEDIAKNKGKKRKIKTVTEYV